MGRNMNGLSHEFIIHPGETLKEILEDREMSQRELSIRTCVTEAHVSKIIRGQTDISVDYAKKLEYALNVDAGFWINLQANYNKELADFHEWNNIKVEEFSVLKRLKEITIYLKEKGLLTLGSKDSNGPILIIELRRLLNISCLTQIPKVSEYGAYRLATGTNIDPYVLFAWIRICDLINESIVINNDLDLGKLSKRIPDFKNLMFSDEDAIENKLKKYLGECGIKFAIVKHFKGAPVQGVIKKNNDDTLSLTMTNRRKFADIFWFTFFHEIGHILNGNIKDRLIDYEIDNNDIESSADSFASNTLIDPVEYERFVSKADYSATSIQSFSQKHNIPPFTLIGRLQKDRYISYSYLAEEKVKYEFE